MLAIGVERDSMPGDAAALCQPDGVGPLIVFVEWGSDQDVYDHR